MTERAAPRIVQSLYEGAAAGWASGAELVYGPLAQALVACSPEDLRGASVLDVGAGTGAGSRALRAVGASPVAVDFVHEMLQYRSSVRPPAAVGDVRCLPVRSSAFAAVIAPFVLNHVDDPVRALRELSRVVRPGGVVLASTFSENDRPPVKDQIDEVASRRGWVPPESYRWLKTAAVPLLGSAPAMEEAARAAGLTDVVVVEAAVDVGISSPEALVRYRLGQAHVAGFLAALTDPERAAVFAEAAAVVRAHHDGSNLAPVVVLLVARRRRT